MIEYVLGFAFTEDKEQVVLIRKNRPQWQAGKLNGVGGKIEVNETPAQAMSREFKEETGVYIPDNQWSKYAKVYNNGFNMTVFAACSDTITDAQSMTDEEILILPSKNYIEFEDHGIENLCWLLMAAKDHFVNGFTIDAMYPNSFLNESTGDADPITT